MGYMKDAIVEQRVDDLLEKSGGASAYKKFFDGKLKKYGAKSPADLSKADKKKFYDEVDREWEGDNEED